MFAKCLGAAAATMTLAGMASAATVYTDRASYNAAGAGPGLFTDLNFGGNTTPAPFTLGPVTVDGSATYWTTGTAGLYGYVNDSAWIQARLDTFGNTMTVSSTTSFSAIGFDIRSYYDGFGGDLGEAISFLTDTGESGTFMTPATPDAGFVGLLFSSQVNWVMFGATDGGGNSYSWFGVDNVQFWKNAATAGVPEPATWGLLIAGFALVGGASRRRRRVAVSFA